MTTPQEPYRKARKPRLGQQLPPLPVMATQVGGRAVSDIFLERGRALLPELQEIRRDLHKHPEVGLEMPRTQRAVLDALEGLPLEINRGQDLSSVVCVLRGGKRG
ncbi:MAG: amidohydrolase, partial [Corynebacterium flavescens]|nr:amidohydrolase [Corynebacterium flavescens]